MRSLACSLRAGAALLGRAAPLHSHSPRFLREPTCRRLPEGYSAAVRAGGASPLACHRWYPPPLQAARPVLAAWRPADTASHPTHPTMGVTPRWTLPAVARQMVLLLHLLLLAPVMAFPVCAQRLTQPFPVGNLSHVGSLQRMPELQCFLPLHTDTLNASIDDVHFKRGNGSCTAPVVNVGEVLDAQVGKAVEERSTNWLLRNDRSLPRRVRGLAETWPEGRSSSSWFLPPERESDGQSTTDFEAVTGRPIDPLNRYRALIAGYLTLKRNSDSGEVLRVSGKYEVLAVTSVTRAVCLRSDCSDLTAVDTTGLGACSSSTCDGYGPPNWLDMDDPEDALTIVTHTATEGGSAETMPVSAVHSSFLGLGRAAMVREGWLPRPTWSLTSALNIWLYTSPGRTPEEMGGGQGVQVAPHWTLNGGANASTTGNGSNWLAKVAFVLCQEPVPKYLDKELLCKGVPQQKPVDEEVMYNKKAYRTRDRFGRKSAVAEWAVIPARGERSSVENCTSLNILNLTTHENATQLTEPLWLAGAAAREINGASPEEVALAGRLGRCSVPVPVDIATWRLRQYARERRRDVADEVVDDLTSGRREGVDAPDDAFSRSEAFVTGFLVALTAIGAITFVPNDPNWKSKRDVARFFVTITVGLGSVASFGLLYWKERKGERWIASLTHKAIAVNFSNTTIECYGLPTTCSGSELGLRGTSVFLSETLAVVTTNGYRPHKVLLLAWVALGIYIIVVSAIFVGMLARSRGRLRTPNAKNGGGADKEGGGKPLQPQAQGKSVANGGPPRVSPWVPPFGVYTMLVGAAFLAMLNRSRLLKKKDNHGRGACKDGGDKPQARGKPLVNGGPPLLPLWGSPSTGTGSTSSADASDVSTSSADAADVAAPGRPLGVHRQQSAQRLRRAPAKADDNVEAGPPSS